MDSKKNYGPVKIKGGVTYNKKCCGLALTPKNKLGLNRRKFGSECIGRGFRAISISETSSLTPQHSLGPCRSLFTSRHLLLLVIRKRDGQLHCALVLQFVFNGFGCLDHSKQSKWMDANGATEAIPSGGTGCMNSLSLSFFLGVTMEFSTNSVYKAA